MRKKNSIILLTIIAIFIIIKLIAFFEKNFPGSRKSSIDTFRNTSHFILTKHAKCRMQCRHISLQELKKIVKDGEENYAKDGEGSKGDKTFAIDGYSTERQHIRVVVAPESDGLVVITCIDLDKEWPCNCN